MKYAGLLLLPVGLLLVVAALAMFPAGAAQSGFIVAGVAVEALGLGVAFRGHMAEHREAGR